MIEKRELAKMQAIAGLHLHVVEKDYALGWLLWGISCSELLAEHWLFKGGTCLRKCFFETHRFSEDLDFTLTDSAQMNEAFLANAFAQVSDCVYKRSGLEFPVAYQKFSIYTNPRGGRSCQAKIGYQGPVSPPPSRMPRIKMDLAADESVALAPVRSSVFHPYSDAPDGGIHVRSLAYEEAFGEKVAALLGRTYPRDLYDSINLFFKPEARPDAALLLEIVRRKYAHQGLALPEWSGLMQRMEKNRTRLGKSWETMLGHQVPALVAPDAFWSRLPDFLDWAVRGGEPAEPPPCARAAGEEVIRDRIPQLPISPTKQSHLTIACFAASNRLCVDLIYQGERCKIEPYSLRRHSGGAILLHAHDLGRGALRALRADRIQEARVTDQPFEPRYLIELV